MQRISFIILCLATIQLANADDRGQVDYFEKRVRPLIAEQCGDCHGVKKQESGLRLDNRESILKGGDRGPAAIAGNANDSLLMQAIRHDGDLQMPEKKLSDEQIAVFENWINQGLFWPETVESVAKSDASLHWSFQPRRNISPPKIENDWPRNPIDNFVALKVSQAELIPAKPANRRTLIRRATVDLLGLPPTPQEIDDFENDTSPEAYEKVIDRLLDSPHYGERWARHWLDIARYADNKGYVFFEDKNFAWAWTYRDWVIRALNEDLPYDQFVLQQLAADQLELDEDKRALAAMGFLTVGAHFVNNTHDIIDDRIDVVSRGLMGLTVTCARCHDHKFDPIPQADYYSLYGVFRSSVEPTVLPLFQPKPDDPEYAEYEKGLQERVEKLESFVLAQRDMLMQGARQRAAEYLNAVFEKRAHPTTEDFMLITDKGAIIPAIVHRWEVYLKRIAMQDDPVWIVWSKFFEIPDGQFAAQSASVHQALLANKHKINPLVLKQFESGVPKSMSEVAEKYGELLKSIDQQWQEKVLATKMSGHDPPQSFDDGPNEQVRQTLYGKGVPAMIPESFGWGFLDLLPDRPTQDVYKKLLKEVERFSTAEKLAPPRAMVLVDAAEPYNPAIFLRGNANRQGESVPRRFLKLNATEHPPAFTNGSGRLELAQAIVDPANPLTSRVIVNRIWQHHFGKGLVDTPSDFGLQGARPSHPELLDWLANAFIENGWSIKQLHRLIMTSATYRQSAETNDAKQTIDPENRLLSRFGRRRVDFETMRDSMIAVTGQLEPNSKGPPVQLLDGFQPRRTIYGFVDRMDVANVLRNFDFPDPIASSGKRVETSVPAQALYFLNHQFVRTCAGKVLLRDDIKQLTSDADKVKQIYRILFGRVPAAKELESGFAFLNRVEPEFITQWKYGFGSVDESKSRVNTFHELKHWTGERWQAGPQLPDPQLGWVFTDRTGGHPAASPDRCSIRRWTANFDGMISIEGEFEHQVEQGNGVRGRIISSSQGTLGQWKVHHSKETTKVDGIGIKKGDTIDFVVDFQENILHDEHIWKIKILSQNKVAADSVDNFHGHQPDTWTDFVHALLMTNEFHFIE